MDLQGIAAYSMLILLLCCAMQVVEEILQLCTPVQLGMLETVCKYFRQSELMAEVVKQRLFNIKRAEDLKPVSR